MTETKQIYCPYCGETLEVAIDCSVRRQEYIEDCQVCCRPIVLRVTLDDGEDGPPLVTARSEEE